MFAVLTDQLSGGMAVLGIQRVYGSCSWVDFGR